MRTRVSLALGTVALVAAACGGASDRPAPRAPAPAAAAAGLAPAAADQAECSGRTPPPTFAHVVWIFMENHTYGQVIGSAEAPFETALAHRCGTATRYASVGRPSMPNYIGATSGDTHGIADDAAPASHPLTADNLFRQVRKSGRSARSYEETMATNCALDSSGDYAVKHNPAAYYAGGDDRTACASDDVALGTPTGGALADALDHDTLPAFSFITPDLCHDTHNCGVDIGDKWLATWIPRLTASAAYQSGTTAIFVAWDEYTPMPSIVISSSTKAATVSDSPVDHYALLRTTEELLGLQDFLGHAAQAKSMRADFGL